MPWHDSPVRTNPLMYAVAIWLVVLGWIAAAPIMASSWNDLRTASVTQLENGKKIDVTAQGVAFFTDIDQGRDVTCRSKPDTALRIQGGKVDIANDDGDHTWHLLSRTIDAKAGSYAVACTPKDKGVDTANYGYAAMPGSFQSRKNIGKGIGSIATFAAIILAGWTWWGRRTDRKLASLESS